MAQVLKFQDTFDGRRVGARPHGQEIRASALRGMSTAQRDEKEQCDFWPEVSTRYSLEVPATRNPENSPQRVLFEMFSLLAGACALVLAVSLFVPSSPL